MTFTISPDTIINLVIFLLIMGAILLVPLLELLDQSGFTDKVKRFLGIQD